MEMYNFAKPTAIEKILSDISGFVSETLGPSGKYVVIGNEHNVHTTKDGVSCLRLIKSNNPYVNNVVTVIKEASESVLRRAGDGTTSTIVLAEKMLNALKNNQITEEQLSSKIEEMVNKIDKIKIKDIDKIKDKIVLTAVSGDKNLANLINSALKLSTSDNIVVETKLNSKSKVEIINGVLIRCKTAAEVFENQSKIKMSSPLIVCNAGTVETERECVELLEKAREYGYKNLIIISNGFSDDAIGVLSINHLQGVMNILPVVVGGDDTMKNVDIVKILSSSLNAPISGIDYGAYLSDVNIDDFVPPKKAFFYDNNLTVEDIEGEKDLKLIEKYKAMLRDSKDDYEAAKYRAILAILEREVVKIIIGTSIENKAKEIRDRVDDALHSYYKSKIYGAMPGAGESYLKLNDITSDASMFVEIFSAIRNKIEKNGFPVDKAKNVYDSALTIEEVLKSSSELAILLNNISYIVNVEVGNE